MPFEKAGHALLFFARKKSKWAYGNGQANSVDTSMSAIAGLNNRVMEISSTWARVARRSAWDFFGAIRPDRVRLPGGERPDTRAAASLGYNHSTRRSRL